MVDEPSATLDVVDETGDIEARDSSVRVLAYATPALGRSLTCTVVQRRGFGLLRQ